MSREVELLAQHCPTALKLCRLQDWHLIGCGDEQHRLVRHHSELGRHRSRHEDSGAVSGGVRHGAQVRHLAVGLLQNVDDLQEARTGSAHELALLHWAIFPGRWYQDF